MIHRVMLKVLVIEDNSRDVFLIREAIRKLEALTSVAVAGDGEDALQCLTSFQPDIIFLDLSLPRMNGLEFLDEYRPGGTAPVVIFTGSANPLHNELAFELGANEYVIKPSNVEAYFDAVRHAIERWTQGDAPESAETPLEEMGQR